jgi:hypothetical protein
MDHVREFQSLELEMGDTLRFNNKLSFLKSVITLIFSFFLGIANFGSMEALSEESRNLMSTNLMVSLLCYNHYFSDLGTGYGWTRTGMKLSISWRLISSIFHVEFT